MSKSVPLYRMSFMACIICSQILLLVFCNVSKAHNFHIQDTSEFVHPLDTLEPKMNSYEDQGYEYYMAGDYDSASLFYTKTLEIAQKILSQSDLRLGYIYINFGTINMALWDYNTSLEMLNKAEDIFTKIDPYHKEVGSVCVNKGIIYRRLRDYSKAIDYYNHAISVFEKQESIDYNRLHNAYWNLAMVYSLSENYEKSNEYFNRSLLFDRSRSKSVLLAYYSSVATNYRNLGKVELADETFQKALKLAENIQSFYPTYPYPAIYLDYGVFQLDERRNLENAKNLFFKSLQNFKKYPGKFSRSIAVCYHNLGEVYYYLNDVDSAFYYLQSSLVTAIEDFQNDDIYSNPSPDFKSPPPRILSTLKFKAKVFKLKYDTYKDLNDLKFSLNTYLLIYDLIDHIRLMYDRESSNFLISKQEDETYINGILVAERLFNLTGDKSYLEAAFMINEKRKSFTLLTSIRKSEAKDFGGIPANLLNNEHELFNLISGYEELIFEERKKNSPNQDLIKELEDLRFNSLNRYDDLVNMFESDYPEYYRLKYDATTKTIEQIQASLNSGEVLIEYVLTDSSLLTFIIEKNKAEIYNKSVDSTFKNNIDFIRNNLSFPQFSENARKNYRGYCTVAFDLYNRLFGSISQQISNKSLIIVPDGLLWYIPFESLITTPINEDDLDYRNLPYLIRKNPISYTYSATIHFEEIRVKTEPTKELLAFAPDYSNLYAQAPVRQDYLEAYRDNLMPIPGVQDEVKMINRLITGDVFRDDSATESRFKEMAGDYNILHLAMHTVVNNEDPMYSKLAFQQMIDEEDDGFLNTYEIYNMRFNARMAVLSSCNTGYGKLMKGEGVMSLARGFMYAGCPSIVMTLWEVSDKSGARLMQDFYKHLRNGKSKAEALQQAKLDFLKKSDNLRANPYFWSTYVIIGDSSALYPKRIKPIYWITGLLLVSGIIIIGFIWKRNRNRGKDAYKPNSIYS